MNRTNKILLGSFLIFSLLSSNTFAQGRGEGGVLIRDGVSIFLSASGPKTRDTNLPRGIGVAGVTTVMGMDSSYQFEESNGRVHVIYVIPDNNGVQKSIYRYGWISRTDLASFTYECGCTTDRERNKCYPLAQAGFTTMQLNVCFKDGMNKKLAELRPTWEKTTDSSTIVQAIQNSVINESVPLEKTLTNDDVLALSKAELGEDIVISKIQQAPSEMLDVTVTTLIKLRTDGLSKAILEAMVKRAGLRK